MMKRDESTRSVTRRAGWDTFSSAYKVILSVLLAAVIVLACMIFIWSWSPSYKILFRSIDDQEVTAVLNTLYSNGIDVKLDQTSGAILVPAKDIHRARITLSNYGLPATHSLTSLYENMGANSGPQLPENNLLFGNVEYTQKVENVIRQRIEHLLEPLVGYGSVRAQVTLIQKDKSVNNTDASNKKINPVRDSDITGYQESMSVIVLIDDKKRVDENGNIIRVPRTEQEIEKFTDLIKKSVGFNKGRGDSISLINSSFTEPAIQDVVPETITWRNSLAEELLKNWVGVILLIIIIAFMMFKLIKSIFDSHKEDNYAVSGIDANKTGMDNPSEIAIKHYEDNLQTLNSLVKSDPKLVAQIMKNWVNADEK